MAGADRIDRSDVSARREQLDEILAELMRASDGGETVDRDEWLARYPDFPAELQEYFDRHAHAEEWFSPLREAAAHGLSSADSTRDDENLTSQSERIGPFKLLQQIGEGGMGSVWMAEQEEPVRHIHRRLGQKYRTSDWRQIVADSLWNCRRNWSAHGRQSRV